MVVVGGRREQLGFAGNGVVHPRPYHRVVGSSLRKRNDRRWNRHRTSTRHRLRLHSSSSTHCWLLQQHGSNRQLHHRSKNKKRRLYTAPSLPDLASHKMREAQMMMIRRTTMRNCEGCIVTRARCTRHVVELVVVELTTHRVYLRATDFYHPSRFRRGALRIAIETTCPNNSRQMPNGPPFHGTAKANSRYTIYADRKTDSLVSLLVARTSMTLLVSSWSANSG